MFTGTLFPFQEEAVDRMIERGQLLVAFDMGLGKTVLSIAAAEHLIGDGQAGNVIVVTLATLKDQWKRMIDKFTDGASVLIVGGTPKQRLEQYKKIRSGEIEYSIMNYEQIVSDWEYVQFLPRDIIVLDECTAIKGFKAKRSRRVKRLDAPYKFGLSGQPIENRAEEAFSIMQWIDPTVLGRFDIFDRTFIARNQWGAVKHYKNLPLLHKLLSEAMVRRKREDVEDQMPKVLEEEILVDFDSPGAKLYRYISKDLLAELATAITKFGTFSLWHHYHGGGGGAENAARGKIMSRLTCLRMLCDHPELLRISASLYDGTQKSGGGTASGSAYASELKNLGLLDDLKKSPKFEVTMETVDQILSEDPRNKIVVFSFFKHTLKLFAQALALRGVSSVQFTGDMNLKARNEAKLQFESDPYCRVFLSSDAGGVGLDLPEANYLINFDLPWSAGKLDQRNARIVRLSSEWKSVTVITMMMNGSIEERMYDMLVQKRAIASAIVDGKGIDKKGRLTLDLKSLTEFLTTSKV